MVNPDDFLAALRAESAHITAFAADRDLGVPSPPCPGMSTGEVVRHLGGVYRMVIGWVRTQERPAAREREPEGGDLVAWFRDTAEELYDELAGRRPEDPAGTFYPPDQTIGFWWRRMAHETIVHRADIEAGYGPIGPIDPELATDGTDEVLSVYLTQRARPAEVSGVPAIVGVSAGAPLWRVELGKESVTVSRELPSDADAVVMGDPVGVYLWLWGRRGDDAVRVNGNPDAAATLRAVLATAT